MNDIKNTDNSENSQNLEDDEDRNVNLEKSEYNYREYSTIKLLHANSNEIEEIPFEEYIYGVVSAEMPVIFEVEALKAQAVVARTYTIYKILNNNRKAWRCTYM